MYNAAYIQHVDELTEFLYNYEKDKKKLTKKIKCIVKEAYYMSRKGSNAPFVPATPAEWMSLFYQDKTTCKRYIKNRDVVYYPNKLIETDNLKFQRNMTTIVISMGFEDIVANIAAGNTDLIALFNFYVKGSGTSGDLKYTDIFGESAEFNVMLTKFLEKYDNGTVANVLEKILLVYIKNDALTEIHFEKSDTVKNNTKKYFWVKATAQPGKFLNLQAFELMNTNKLVKLDRIVYFNDQKEPNTLTYDYNKDEVFLNGEKQPNDYKLNISEGFFLYTQFVKTAIADTGGETKLTQINEILKNLSEVDKDKNTFGANATKIKGILNGGTATNTENISPTSWTSAAKQQLSNFIGNVGRFFTFKQ